MLESSIAEFAAAAWPWVAAGIAFALLFAFKGAGKRLCKKQEKKEH